MRAVNKIETRRSSDVSTRNGSGKGVNKKKEKIALPKKNQEKGCSSTCHEKKFQFNSLPFQAK
jgi:hypothetical protein